MTDTTNTTNTTIDALLSRQRRGLVIDSLFAILVALGLVVSMVGLRSTAEVSTATAPVEIDEEVHTTCITAPTSSADLLC